MNTFKAKAFPVNIRARVAKLSNVDTLTGTAKVVVNVYYTWNDPRMIGYPYSTLPDKLWGPMLILQNSGLNPPEIPGDFDGDGVVGGADLGVLLASWGPCPAPCPADLNGDGVVGGADIGLLLVNWG